MSKERELLAAALDFLDPRRWLDPADQHILNILSRDIEELLAQPEQDYIQYLLDQVARLTAENAMLKEKWSTPKPESEQQPEAWIIVNRDTGYRIQVSLFPDLYNKDMFEVIPLYTAPPKRERITNEEIYNHCCAMDSSYTCNFIDGVEWAEQQHGIGVDDE
jgi:hypothetical protein